MRPLSPALVLVVTSLATPLDAQSTWFEALDVTVVNVDVIVTDASGTPIRGLVREDFRLREDGDVVELTNFSAVEAGRLLLDPDLPVEPGLIEAGERARSSPAASESGPRLDLMILVDDTSLQLRSRRRLVEGVITALEKVLRPGDRALVAVNDGSVRLALPLSANREAVADALTGLLSQASRASGSQAELVSIVREIEAGGVYDQDFSTGASRSGIAEEGRAALARIRQYAAVRYQDAIRSTRAIRSWIESLSALPGRKAVLLLSDGFSRNPAEAILEAWVRKFAPVIPTASSDAAAFTEFDTAQALLDLADFANAYRVTLYAIGGDTPALAAATPEQRGLDTFGQRVWTPALQSLEESNLRTSLTVLAEHTGGSSGFGSSAVRPLLDRVRDDFDDYYSLAYSPRAPKPGAQRSISVELARPIAGHRLRYRASYREQSAEERLDAQALSAVLLGEGENPLGVEVGFGRAIPAEAGLVDIPVVVRIPLSRLVLVPGETHHEGRLAISFTTRDELGRTAPVQRIGVPIRVPNDQLDAVLHQSGGWGTTVRLRTRPHRLGIALRDLYGAVDSTVVVDIDPERYQPDFG